MSAAVEYIWPEGRYQPKVIKRCRLATAVHTYSHLTLDTRADVKPCVLHSQPAQNVIRDPSLVIDAHNFLREYMGKQRESQIAVVTSNKENQREQYVKSSFYLKGLLLGANRKAIIIIVMVHNLSTEKQQLQ